MNDQCEDWGVPDWRDADAYPKPNELKLDEWRWEFLRRRSDFRTAYMRSEEEFIGESKGRHFERVYKIANLKDPRLSVLDLKTRHLPPDNPFPPYFDIVFLDTSLWTHYADPWDPWNRERRPRVEPQPYHMDFRVDLRRSLGSQFEEFAKLAADEQKILNKGKKIHRRAHKDKWPLYLQVLDARDSGASYSQIAHTILQHQQQTEQAARDVIKQAEALRNNFRF